MNSTRQHYISRTRVFLHCIPFIILILIGCNRKKIKELPEDKVFGNNLILKAQRISIEKVDGYSRVTVINPWQGADNINLVYNLVRRDSLFPSDLDSSDVIFVPVRSIVCMSTTHVAMISVLGEDNTVSGVSGPGYVYSESLTARIDAGQIADVGYDSGLNKELILSIAPDLVMMYGIGSESAGYVGKIKELGIKVVFNADYLETDPIGKAEWIKLFGALYCKENLADSIFNSELMLYENIRSYISENTTVKPKILLGLPYKDTWYISPGNSFISKIIADSGGDYIWKETESSVSMPYGIENVYMGALKADFWLNIGSIKSKNEIDAVDPRLTKLPCYKKGNLFNNNNRVTMKGGNDYWERGTVFPHLILKDIAAVIHPELFKEHELFFYQKIK